MATLRCLSLGELRVITTPQPAVPGPDNGVDGAAVPDAALFDLLMFTALDATVIDKHLTAACNALCFVALRMSNAADDQVRANAFSADTWLGLVDVVRKAFHDGKNKPALQVLDALSTLAQSHPDMPLAQSNIERTVNHLLRTLFCRDPATEMKQACIMISFFLRKLSDFMTFPELLRQSFDACRSILLRRYRSLNHRAIFGADHVNPAWCAFALALILATGHPDSKSAALKLLTFIYTSANDQLVQNSIVRAVEICSSGGPEAPANVVRTILPAILDTPLQLQTFLNLQEQQASSSPEHILVLLTAIEVAREKGFLSEQDVSKLLRSQLSVTYDDSDPFDRLLSHHNSAVRLKAFKLLTMSNSPNVPFAQTSMNCLLRNFPVLLNDTDAYMRSEIISTIKRLCTRLKLSRASTIKRQLHAQPSSERPSYVQHCDDFACALLECLDCELSVHHTYSRHILALNSVLVLYDTFADVQQAMHLSRFQHGQFVNRLVVLVLDAYDDVRALAMQILHRISQDTSLALLADSDLRAVSKLTANTNRADHADAYGRLLLLVSTSSVITLKSNGVQNAHDHNVPNLVSAVARQLSDCISFNISDDFPLHGTLLGISYCLPHIEQVLEIKSDDIQSLLSIARKIWSLAQPHLCVDSPEMETEDDDDDLAGPKDLLAYAWRALRDSNVMLQAVLRSPLLTKDFCEAVGDLTFEQLSLLRHRGAFSSVAQTFVLCCDKLREGKTIESQNVLERWFKEAIVQIEAQADRLTRRSAGLPSMFAAILDPKSVAAFAGTFNRLIALASTDTSDDASAGLPEVHALNCLKDIMTNSRFRQVSEAFLLDMIGLAAKRVSSEVWAVKNCGLMLLRACINRLDNTHVLGDRTQENLLETATNDADPATIATRLLEHHQHYFGPTTNGVLDAAIAHRHVNNEAIFASLDLLGRVYIKRRNKDRTIHAITAQLGHSVWHIRTQASRLLAHIVLPSEELSLVESLLCLQNKGNSSNGGHGAYLGAYALLLKLLSVAEEDEFRTNFVHLLSRAADLSVDGITMPIAALWLDMTNALLALPGITTLEIETIVASFVRVLTGLQTIECQPSASFKRSRALFVAYLQILAPDLITNYPAWSVLETDEDIAEYMILHVASFIDPVHASRAVRLVTKYIEPQQAPSVLAAALSVFASLLPRCPDHLNGLSVDHIAELISFEADGNRDWLLAQVLAYATIIVHSSSILSDGVASNIGSKAPTFIRVLRLAAADEVDPPTRETALQTLSQLLSVFHPNIASGTLLKPEQQSELLLILYDLLNDDDEDLRAEAATVVHSLLIVHGAAARHSLPECAYSARTQLRSFIVLNDQDQEEFIPRVLVKIFGIQSSSQYLVPTQAVLDHCEKHTVGRDLQAIASRAQDLFAEEKQNLYVDEVADVNAWVESLISCQASHTGKIRDALQKWCSSALKDIAQLLREDNEYREWQRTNDREKWTGSAEYMILSEQTLFSVTNNPEVLITLLRAIVTARLLTRWNTSAASEALATGLEDLEKVSAQGDVHHEIKAALAK